MANYADDSTLYTMNATIENLLNTLESETSTILDWFRLNEMKPNDDKCHLMICNHDNLSVKLGKEKIKSVNSVKLLGITIDKNLNFTAHVSELIKKGNQSYMLLQESQIT